MHRSAHIQVPRASLNLSTWYRQGPSVTRSKRMQSGKLSDRYGTAGFGGGTLRSGRGGARSGHGGPRRRPVLDADVRCAGSTGGGTAAGAAVFTRICLAGGGPTSGTVASLRLARALRDRARLDVGPRAEACSVSSAICLALSSARITWKRKSRGFGVTYGASTSLTSVVVTYGASTSRTSVVVSTTTEFVAVRTSKICSRSWCHPGRSISVKESGATHTRSAPSSLNVIDRTYRQEHWALGHTHTEARQTFACW